MDIISKTPSLKRCKMPTQDGKLSESGNLLYFRWEILSHGPRQRHGPPGGHFSIFLAPHRRPSRIGRRNGLRIVRISSAGFG